MLAVIAVAPTLAEGDGVAVQARASWLACSESCAPGEAELALTLPVRTGPPAPAARWQAALAAAHAALPQPFPGTARLAVGADQLVLSVAGAPLGAGLHAAEFFPASDA